MNHWTWADLQAPQHRGCGLVKGDAAENDLQEPNTEVQTGGGMLQRMLSQTDNQEETLTSRASTTKAPLHAHPTPELTKRTINWLSSHPCHVVEWGLVKESKFNFRKSSFISITPCLFLLHTSSLKRKSVAHRIARRRQHKGVVHPSLANLFPCTTQKCGVSIPRSLDGLLEEDLAACISMSQSPFPLMPPSPPLSPVLDSYNASLTHTPSLNFL